MKNRKILFIVISSILIACIVALSVYVFAFYLPKKQKEAETERLIKEYYDNKLSYYQTENDFYADYEVDVAFLGDSLTDGYDLKTYYPNLVTSNRGIGGETTYGLESRMQVSVYDLKPKIAVMLIGGNNLKTMFDNYENLLSGLKTNLPDTKVIIVSLTAMGGSWAHKNETATYNNVIIKKLANKYGYSFVDSFTPLFNEETGEIYSNYTSDGVHLTHDGYVVLTNAIYPEILKLLEN